MSFPLIHPFLWLNFGSLVPHSPLLLLWKLPQEVFVCPQTKLNIQGSLSFTLGTPSLLLLVGLPSLLSFVPIVFPLVLPSTTPSLRSHDFLIMIINVKTTHIDNLNN